MRKKLWLPFNAYAICKKWRCTHMNGYIKNQIFICVKNNMHAEKYVKKYICVLAAVEPYMRRGRYAFWRQNRLSSSPSAVAGVWWKRRSALWICAPRCI